MVRIGKPKQRRQNVGRNTNFFQLAPQAKKDPTIAPQLLAGSHELEVVWSGFQFKDYAVIDTLCTLGLSAEYSSTTIVETGRLVNYNRFIADHYEDVNNADPGGSDNGSAGVSLIHNYEGGRRAGGRRSC